MSRVECWPVIQDCHGKVFENGHARVLGKMQNIMSTSCGSRACNLLGFSSGGIDLQMYYLFFITYMQFLAARSRCTTLLLSMCSIPDAI